MDLPQPPADIELKNIIDKLAQFVARNGPEFEQMTKNKQKDNPKFSFLFGGDLFNYYQYKVTTEQAILKVKSVARDTSSNNQQAAPLTPEPPAPPLPMTPIQILNAAAANSNSPWLVPPHQHSNPTVSVSTLIEQQNVLQQQITQSEQNLAAQHAALLQTQDAVIEDAIRKFQSEKINQKAIECGVDVNQLNNVLQPIIDSCTKDSISAGKAWILNHTSQGAQDVVAECLLQKVISPGVAFTHKLHIIYLINDVMHHCVRKNADNLKKSLEKVVVPMVCNSWICGTEDQQAKLKKLLNLWETKNTYFTPEVISQLKSPEASWSQYRADLAEKHKSLSEPAQRSTQSQYENYRSQHEIFVNHALSQIQTLETQKMQLEQQQQQEAQLQLQLQLQNIQPPPAPIISGEGFEGPPPIIPPMAPPSGQPFTQPPPPLFSHLPPELVPDFSKPPPGFQAEAAAADDLVPSVPYYELPAGLMVPLIGIDDFTYKPLDPRKLRLPPAIPPNDRLVQAVEAFYQRTYSGNSRERLILDADGWEKLGLYEYYKAKNAARKQKQLDIEAGLREKSESPPPIKRERSRSRSPKKKRCYTSPVPSPGGGGGGKAKSRSRSRSPPPRHETRHNRSSNGRKSPRRTPRNNRRSRSRSKSPSPPPALRSASPPPSFLGVGAFQPEVLEEKLDESNKGHQMLRKMGWGGAGLGSKEQGIAAPISGGEVRDRVDQYKGVGVSLHDPYENFRKNKGKAFITRMKARAEERSNT